MKNFSWVLLLACGFALNVSAAPREASAPGVPAIKKTAKPPRDNDSKNHYDFESEKKIADWKLVSRVEREKDFRYAECVYESVISEPAEGFLTWTIHDDGFTRFNPIIDRARVNGKLLQKSEIAFVGKNSFRYAYFVKLRPGDVVQIDVRSAESDPTAKFNVRIAPPFTAPRPAEKISAVVPVGAFELPECTPMKEIDLSGYLPGLGTSPAPGRFGFKKGDGVLDCAVPMLGVIDKEYLNGHPDYKRPFKWTCRFYPENLPLHGSSIPAEQGIGNDRIEVNPLSVRWQSGDFSCRYSLASPGIVFEDKQNEMTLSSLQYAGNYHYMLIPDGEVFRLESISGEPDLSKMTENFVVLFGTGEFPDIPIMLSFDRAPGKIEVKYTGEGRLSSIRFPGVNRIIFSTPLGIESPAPIRPDDRETLVRVIQRCRFWSRAFLAYPVAVREYFRCDDDAKKVHVVQKFTYCRYTDDWGTPPIETAVYPPVATLSPSAKLNPGAVDFAFPTKYGYLQGMLGDAADYTLDDMPTQRKFPLAEKNDEPLKMDDFFAFQANFPVSLKAYPYAGALLEPYALPSTLMNFMTDHDREKMRAICSERTAAALDENLICDYPVIRFDKMLVKSMTEEKMLEVYRSPEMRHIHPANWFDRIEPFTGAAYKICYLNVWLFSYGWIKEGTREEVLKLNMPLIENDWGAGLTFYYLYLASLAEGSFKNVKENWHLIEGAFDYFRNLCDYACMGTGQSDLGTCWVEGANYGAFTSFVNMAKMIGDDKAYQTGRYYAAKQLALRLAVFRASQHYFYRYFHHEPWYTSKFFHEEDIPGRSFLSVPDLTPENFARDGVYNLTTEGLYPEIFDALRKYVPDDLKLVAEKLAAAMRSSPPPDPVGLEWTFNQCCASLPLMDDSYLEEVEKCGRLFNRWRGIHIFSRYLPENYFRRQILAWRRMKDHPAHLLNWRSVKIKRAVYEPENRRAVIELAVVPDGMTPLLRLGIREKIRSVALTGKPLEWKEPEPGVAEIAIPGDGVLEIVF